VLGVGRREGRVRAMREKKGGLNGWVHREGVAGGGDKMRGRGGGGGRENKGAR